MLAIAHPVVAAAHHPPIRSSSSSYSFHRPSRHLPSTSSTTRPPIHAQVKSATPPPPPSIPHPAPAPPPTSSTPPPINIHSYPTPDLLRLLASLLTQIAATNDALSPAVTPSHSPVHAHPDVHSVLWPTLTTASRGSLATASSTLTFHARNIPTISLEAYLLRILKYCPTTNEVFLALLVYFDRMSKMSNDVVGRSFVIDSYNIHRLVIAGVTVASKFFSDVFYTNSRYAKVGGLPLTELNELELQFLLLNDFRLVISTAEMQRYAEQLILFSTSNPDAAIPTLNPAPTPASSRHLTNSHPIATSTPPAPSPSPSPSPAPSASTSSSTSLVSAPSTMSSSHSQRSHPRRPYASSASSVSYARPPTVSLPHSSSQPSHAALAHMGAIDAYGGALPGSAHGPHGKVYAAHPTNMGAGTSYVHGRSSSLSSASFTRPHTHPALGRRPTEKRIRTGSGGGEDEDEEGQSDTETETETEAETEGGESASTTDDEPTIRPGSVYGPGGDAGSVYSVESASDRGGYESGRERPESRGSVRSMWDTGDEGGDEGEEEEEAERGERERRGGGEGWEQRKEGAGVQITRKRTRSSGSEWEGCAGGPTTPVRGALRGDYAMGSP